MDKLTKVAAIHARVATPNDIVHNSECVYTFHTPFTSPKGILVNLKTFIATCEKLAEINTNGEDTALFVRIVKARVPKPTDESKDTNQATKLGIGVEGGFPSDQEQYDIVSAYSLILFSHNSLEIEMPYTEQSKHAFPMQISLSIDSIIHHTGSAVQQDLKVWELDQEPLPISKYAEHLPFVENGKMISPNPSEWKCETSGETENLWLNLSDGYIGGGRKNWDGSGGSNGAIDHFYETGERYPLVVKLGTISADIETADCYSYAKDEDGPVKIPNLKELLERRGINVAGMQKTARSTAELEVELNATYAFDAITEAGANLVPVSGPGLQGLQNLGNSCYMNTVVQTLLGGTVPELASRYGIAPFGDVASHPLLRLTSPVVASEDVLTQITKLGTALTSGVFAAPVSDETSATDPKYRVAPRMFKNAVARNHADFCTGQQQDAAQFLQHLLETLDRAELRARGKGIDVEAPLSSKLFAHSIITRVVCSADSMVKYKKGAAETLLSVRIPMDLARTHEEEDEPESKRQKSDEEGKVKTVPSISFKTCLDVWHAPSVIDDYRWPHLGDQVYPASSQNGLGNFPRYLIVQLQRYELGPDWVPIKLEVDVDMPEHMDFSFLKMTGPDASEILVQEDPELKDANSVQNAPPNDQPMLDEVALSQLMDMGFSRNGCTRALTAVGGSDVEAAMNWIFEHNMDPNFNDPLVENAGGGGQGSASAVDEAVVASLVENLGCFTSDQARAALSATGGAMDRAADWLFSHMDDLDSAIAALTTQDSHPDESRGGSTTKTEVTLDDGGGKYTLVGCISHIGKNVGSGHYVCHLKKGGKWVIFNDEKVALSEHPPLAHAYIYLFQRDDTFGSPDVTYSTK